MSGRRRTSVPNGAGPRGRIVLIVPDYLPSLGGTTTQTRMHALELARRGWEVVVLTRRISWGRPRDHIEGLVVRRVGLPVRGKVGKVPHLACVWWWLLRRRKAIGAVSAIMDADYALCARLAKVSCRVVLTWVTCGDPSRQLSGAKGRIRLRALCATSHVALTPAMASELEVCGVRGAAVVGVPVDLDRFRPPTDAERSRARAAQDVGTAHAIVYVGHLQERKGVDRLLEAVKLLREQGHPTAALVVGGPVAAEDRQYVDRLTRYVSVNGLSSAIRFVGPQRDVVPYLHAGDSFCLASQREGMPNVLLEAMACGVPCVAPPSAGGDDVLGGGAGCVPRSNDASDIAAAITGLLRCEGAREQIRRAGLDKVHASHRVTEIVDRYEALFDG